MTMKLKRTLGCYVLKLKTMLSELVFNFWVKLILGFIVYIFCSMVYVYLSQKVEIIRYYKYGTTEDLRSSEYVNTKKVLFWNKYLGSEDYNFGIGKRPFVKNKCPFDDCLIIYHKYLFPVEDYDAIVFNGDDFNPWTNLYFPPKRRSNQRYVYYSTSVKRKPPYILDVFYNITITDRIDSDVTIRTFDVFKSTDNKTNKDGINYIKDWDVFYKTKRRIGFWLYYDCKEVNIEIEQLIKELKEVIEVDVFCDCKRGKNCFDKQLQASVFNEYFFIFFIEDPNDFVYNEDIMVALRHRVVPVLFRDVNYDNFLPPNSYFKAGNLSKAALVESVQISTSSLQEFSKYFTWFSSYEIANSLSPFCKLCEILHSDRTVKVYSIDWWNNMYDNVA